MKQCFTAAEVNSSLDSLQGEFRASVESKATKEDLMLVDKEIAGVKQQIKEIILENKQTEIAIERLTINLNHKASQLEMEKLKLLTESLPTSDDLNLHKEWVTA